MKKSIFFLLSICIFLSFDSSFALNPALSQADLLKSAQDGNAEAQSHLGNMYFVGHGVPQNYSEAVKWYRLAAEQGNADGQYNLGLAYERGQGVPRNYVEAVKWYRLAAEQGQPYAQQAVES